MEKPRVAILLLSATLTDFRATFAFCTLLIAMFTGIGQPVTEIAQRAAAQAAADQVCACPELMQVKPGLACYGKCRIARLTYLDTSEALITIV
jgi:hypothetical protein